MKLRWKKEDSEWPGEKYTYTARYKGAEVVVTEYYDGEFGTNIYSDDVAIGLDYRKQEYLSTRRKANAWCYKWLEIVLGEVQ